MDNYSLADIASATNAGGFGGSSAWVLIILFALIFGWGGSGGIGGGRYADSALNTYATASSQQEILFGQQFQNLDNKIDRIGNGLADLGFNLSGSIKDGNYALGSQLADCCCKNQANVDSLRFDMANYSAAIQANSTANAQKVLDALSQNKIESLQAQVSELKTQNMFCGIPRINPYGYGVYAYGTGCNCNGAI